MSDAPATSTPAAAAAPAEEKKEETPSSEAPATEGAPAPAAPESGKDEKKEEKKEEKKAPEVKKMKAIFSTAYGDPEKVLDFGDFPEPTHVKADQVQIKVHSASINPIDYKINHGYLSAFIKKHFPFVPGFDVAGEVIAVGSHVKKFVVGDKVYGDVGSQQGSYAEVLVAPQNVLTKIPAGLTYSQAAGVPLAGLTAYQAIVTYGKITEKSKVLVLGGSSATGFSALQIAKAIGAHVTTTASTRNIEFVRSLGADKVVDYTKDKWWEVLKAEKFDAAFDTVGELGSWEHAKPLLTKHTVFAQIARKEGAYTAGFFATVLGRKIASWFGEPHYKFMLTDNTQTAQLEAIGKWIESGKFKPVIDTVFPFTKEGAVALFKASEASKARGKLILEVIAPETPTKSNVEEIIAAAPPAPVEPAPAPAPAAAEPAAVPAADAAAASSSSSSSAAPTEATPEAAVTTSSSS